MLKKQTFQLRALKMGSTGLLFGSLLTLSACGSGDQMSTENTAKETPDSATQATPPNPSTERTTSVVASGPVGRRERSRIVTVPAGTRIRIEILDPLASNTSKPGDRFTSRVTQDVSIDGRTVIPSGSQITGVVTQVASLKKIGGRAKLGLEFTTLDIPSGGSSPIKASYLAQGKSETKKDAATIGGAAVGGALLGRIIGHKHGDEARGTAVGAAVGAATGTAIAAGTKGQEIVVAAGHTMDIRLDESAQVTLES